MRRLLAVLLAALVLVACAPQPHGPSQATRRADVLAHDYAGLVATPPPGKFMVIIFENKGYKQTLAGAPYLKALGQRYGYATNYRAITHPSQPNYVALLFGSTMGIKDDGYRPVAGASLMAGILAAGQTFGYYNEHMGATPCRTSNVGKYRQKHNAPTVAKDERAQCKAHDLDLSKMWPLVNSGNLPKVSFVIFDICNDAHDCPLSTFNAAVKAFVGKVAAGPDWKSRQLTMAVTADEDNRKEDNRILTTIINPNLRGRVVSTPLNHYGLSRSIARYGGTAPLRNARTATDVLAQFGL